MKNTCLFFHATLLVLRKAMLIMLSVITLTQCQTQTSEITVEPTGGLELEESSVENTPPTTFLETHVADATDATSNTSQGLFRVPITDCTGRAVAILYCDEAGNLTARSTQGKPLRINNAPLPPLLSQNALQVKGNLQQWYARVHHHGLEIVPRLKGGGNDNSRMRELERSRRRLEAERDRIRRENEEMERRGREAEYERQRAEARRHAAEIERAEAQRRAQEAEKEKAEAQRRAQQAEKEKAEQKRRIHEINKKLEQAKATAAKAIAETIALDEEIQGHKKKIEANNQKIEQLEEKLKTCEDKIQIVSKKIAEQEQLRENIEKTCKNVKEKNIHFQEKYDQERVKRKGYRDKNIQRLERKLSKGKLNSEEKKAIQIEIQALREEVENSEQEFASQHAIM